MSLAVFLFDPTDDDFLRFVFFPLQHRKFTQESNIVFEDFLNSHGYDSILRGSTGEEVQAWVYVGDESRLEEHRRPTARYMEMLLGGEDLLPKQHVEWLKRIETWM